MKSKNKFNSDFWNKKKILITGHTGFKGSWLSLWLKSYGADLCGISLEPDSENSLFFDLSLSNRMNHNICNICEKNKLKKIVLDFEPDIVFHLAAQPIVRKSYQDPLETWHSNVIGSLNLLEALKDIKKTCCVVMITTDKVYENKEWNFSYRENDSLGGHDPYSASKAACEIAIASWRKSFCGTKKHQTQNLSIATARAGNVIGGGDWAEDRIVPDVIRALSKKEKIPVRNPSSTRPWQHVLEPLFGYLSLAEIMYENHLNRNNLFLSAYNFGPNNEANQSVENLIKEIFKTWRGTWVDVSNPKEFHEAKLLNLQIDKAYKELGWYPRWSFSQTVKRTIKWYKDIYEGNKTPEEACLEDIKDFVDTL